MVNAFSVDLEEWYHICGIKNLPANIDSRFKTRLIDNTKKVLGILQLRNTKATFFVLGCVAEQFPELIKEIDKYGHEIASHGYIHKQIYKQTKEEFSLDLKKSVDILRQITGKDILGFRAPDFSITKKSLWALDVLPIYGIKYDCSIFPVFHPRYGIANAPRFSHILSNNLVEFPPSTLRLLGCNIAIAGGAYIRILPFSLIKHGIKVLNSKGRPANIYIHPWELDSLQPKLNISWHRKFVHYTNLISTAKKIDQLLADFKFSTIKEVLKIA